MLPPRKWLWSLGLLVAAPVAAMAGPLDALKPKPEHAQSASSRTNQEVANEIASALKAARLVGRDIDIEYQHGVAVLRGQIADETQRAAATRIVSSVGGVKSVENRMSLMSASARGPMQGGVQQASFEGNSRSPIQQVQFETVGDAPGFPANPAIGGGEVMGGNQETAQKIAESIKNVGLQNYDLEIRYSDGACTLRGGVDSSEQALAAAEAASKVSGVKTVLNQMTVRGRPVSVASTTPAENMAMYRPYPNPQAAQMAYQQQMQAHQQQMQHPQMAANGQMGAVRPVSGTMPGPGGPGGPQMHPGGPGPVPPGYPMPGPHQAYNRPNLPDYAWPAYAPYDNYAAVSYPSQYEASAWPYIGPFYPYPQVPAEWRSAQLVWDDGHWNLKFSSKTDKWWWFMNPKNWD